MVGIRAFILYTRTIIYRAIGAFYKVFYTVFQMVFHGAHDIYRVIYVP